MATAEIIPMETRTAAIQVTPMTLIDKAISDPNFAVEKLTQLLELQIRWEQNEAKKAYDIAMARFKASAPIVVKNVRKKAGQAELYYASLDNCVAVIAPALAHFGLRHHWTNDQSVDGRVTVTCVISHELGHSETNAFTANYDNTGSKNAVQAIASTVTYLQRYTLLGATGLAASGTDNDGSGAGRGKSMPDDELANRLDAIEAAGTVQELQDVYTKALNAAKQIGDEASVQDFEKAKNKRYRELKGGAR